METPPIVRFEKTIRSAEAAERSTVPDSWRSLPREVPSIIRSESTGRLLDVIDAVQLIALYRRKGIDITGALGRVPCIGLYRCSWSGVKFFFPVIAGDGDFYETLSTKPWYYDVEKYEFLHAARSIAPGDKVLDVGCGSGNFASVVGEADYTGLEFSSKALASAISRGLTVFDEPIEAHAHRWPGRYDKVVAFQVLEHVTRPYEFLAGCRDALAPGGTLIVSVPNDDAFEGQCVNDMLNLPPHHLSRWSEAALSGLLEKLGFQDVCIHHEPLQAYHRTWFLRQFFLRALYRRLLGRMPAMLERGPVFNAVHVAAHGLAMFCAPALDGDKNLAYGHTLMASARKP